MPKRRSASRSDHSSEDGTRRVAPYVAPTETQVQITNLAALLNGQRMVAPEQQSRLGFEGSPEGRCLRRSLLIGQLHPYNRGGHEESHPPVHLSHEPDRWDGVRYLRV